MRHSWVLGMCLLVSLTAFGGQSNPDESAIKARLDEFAAAWTKDDAKAMAAVWAPTGDIVNPFGRVARGRAEVEKLFTDEHTTFMKGSRWSYSGLRTDAVSADVAVATVDAAVQGAKGPSGEALDIPAHVVTCVFVKKDGKWWVAASRVMIPSPPPPTPPKSK